MYGPRRTRTLLAGLAVTAVLAGGTAGTAAAADSTPRPAHTGDGAKTLCKRVPRIDRRIARALKRLEAGPGTRGSIARLEKRVDNAKKAGHTEIAAYLQNQLDFRTSLLKNLEQRQKDLAAVKVWCQKNDNGRSGSGKAAS